MNQPSISVVIPTYNRKAALLRTLESLKRQTLSADAFEVIVVDDGSTDETATIENESFPFALRYFRQTNNGATQARNLGTHHAKGKTLIFIDDDISISPTSLQALSDHCQEFTRTIILGALVVPEEIQWSSLYARITAITPDDLGSDRPVHYARCQTGLLAVLADDFTNLGGFQDPSGGWPNWDDVDFGYRANCAGYGFWFCTHAIGEHWDYSLYSLESAYNRIYRASQSAVHLIEAHPELKTELAMFRDALPIDIHNDSSRLILRKLLRQAASTLLATAILKRLVLLSERYYPNPNVLQRLYRWVMGAFIYRGYRKGLKESRSRET